MPVYVDDMEAGFGRMVMCHMMADTTEELPCPASWGIGPALTIGVDAKIGQDWDKASMEDLQPPSVASDVVTWAVDDEERDDVTDLGTRVA